MNTKPSFSYGIKGKLISAVSMLLVACIMVVSSTYAWFTLSTAPEVTGISTAIGANGALEIKLDGAEGDTNATWGNLVNLGDPRYGLQDIVLLPSVLNIENNGSINQTLPLKYAVYGETGDGRPVLGADMGKAGLGIYNGSSGFYTSGTANGVYAVGTASGMTERQMAFRNARVEANSAMKDAVNLVDDSLRAEGGTLAKIVVNYVMTKSDVVTKAQVQSLQRIVASLDKALDAVEQAYQQLVIAMAASAEVDTYFTGLKAGETATDAEKAIIENFYTNVEKAFTAATDPLTIANIADNGQITITIDGSAYSCTIPEANILRQGMKDWKTARGDVDAAMTAVNALVNASDFAGKEADDEAATWSGTNGIKATILDKLIKYDTAGAVLVNNKDMATTDKDALVTAITDAGFKVNMTLADGSGVYEALADQVGDFSVNIEINDLSAGGFTVKKFPANMATDSSVVNAEKNSYLPLAVNAVEKMGAPASAGGGDMPLTEFYGYQLNFAFQTNAAGSNLLLQTKPVDRIYSGNANEATQGGGSTMTFKAATSAFTDTQILGLMAAVRVVFFDPSTGTIFAEARLDTEAGHYTVGADGVVANLYIYQPGHTAYKLTYTPEGDNQVATTVTVYKSNDLYYTDKACTSQITLTKAEGEDTYTVGGALKGTAGTITSEEVAGTLLNSATTDKNLDAVITALQQNTAMYVSALLYLDGEELENKDVAYDDAKSVTGMLNLQFASSADLVPMEYGGLHTPGETKYKVTYDLNGATGNPPAVAEVAKDAKANLPATLTDVTAPADKQYFLGWNTNKDATEALTEYTVIADVTLYAIWSATDPNAAATP